MPTGSVFRRFAAIEIETFSNPVALVGLRKNPPHPIFWIIAIALTVIAVKLVFRSDGPLIDGQVLAQSVQSGGSRGVFAFSGQLDKATYGLFMVDVDTMTLWAYEYLSQKGCLRLAAARTWRYDRYLENHNVCDLPPEAVEQMVEDQRKYRLQSNDQQMP